MKKVFLTGASSGIGRATAEALARAGHEVWGTSRDPARVPALPNMHALQLDLQDRSSVQEAFRRGSEESGGFDVLINNAGTGHFGPAEFLSTETLRLQMQVALFGPVQLAQLALHAMRQRERGLIVNVSSLAARLPVPFTAGYNAAKAALVVWSMTAQLELGSSAIRIVDLQPADIDTGFYDPVRREEAHGSPYERKISQVWGVVERNMKQAPPPQLVAERIVRLVADENPPARVTVGGAFQTLVAPGIFALLPPRLRVWGLRRYYGI